MECARCEREIKPLDVIVASRGYPIPRHDLLHEGVRIAHEACYPPVRDGEESWTETEETYRGPQHGY